MTRLAYWAMSETRSLLTCDLALSRICCFCGCGQDLRLLVQPGHITLKAARKCPTDGSNELFPNNTNLVQVLRKQRGPRGLECSQGHIAPKSSPGNVR